MTTKRKSERSADETPRPEEAEPERAGDGEEAEESAGIAIEVEPPEEQAAAADGGGAPEVEAEAESASPEDRLAALERENEALEQRNKENYDRLLRATADLDNFRKRARRDVEDARVEARSRVLREMLPVIDNLERALSHAESAEAADSKGIVEGVTLVLRQFAQALERCEVKPIEAEEQPFDPNVHEAVGQLESPDHPPGTVAQVLQRGYWIGQRLLRPALVVVSKGAPEAGAAGDGEDATPAAGNGEDRVPEEGNGADRGEQA